MIFLFQTKYIFGNTLVVEFIRRWCQTNFITPKTREAKQYHHHHHGEFAASDSGSLCGVLSPLFCRSHMFYTITWTLGAGGRAAHALCSAAQMSPHCCWLNLPWLCGPNTGSFLKPRKLNRKQTFTSRDICKIKLCMRKLI